MGPVTATLTIDAPREQVYRLIVDLSARLSFCDHFIEQFHLQRLEPVGVGAGARFRVGAPRMPIWMETVIAEVDSPYRVIERGRGGRADRIPNGTAWELVEGPAGTTELTVAFWTEPSHPVDKLRERLGAGGWYRRQWRRALHRLRELVEGDEGLEPVRVAGISRI